MKAWIVIVLLLTCAVTPATSAQQPEQEEQRNREEAVRRLEEAQRELQRALEQVRRAETDEARRQMERVMRALREAQRNLGSNYFYWSEGLGPAVSIVTADDRPRMGVFLERTRFGQGADSVGVEIEGVTDGGPADKAGLRPGDVVTRANGRTIGRGTRQDEAPYDKLVAEIRRLDEGDTLRVEYRRGTGTRTANVIVRRLEPESYGFGFGLRRDSLQPYIATIPLPDVRVGPEARMRVGPVVWSLPLGWLDIELVALNPELGAYFGTSEGLLVVRGPEDETLGLKSGDVILSIDGRAPNSPAHALRILRSYGRGEAMTIEVMRDRRRQTLSATVPAREGGLLREPGW